LDYELYEFDDSHGLFGEEQALTTKTLETTGGKGKGKANKKLKSLKSP